MISTSSASGDSPPITSTSISSMEETPAAGRAGFAAFFLGAGLRRGGAFLAAFFGAGRFFFGGAFFLAVLRAFFFFGICGVYHHNHQRHNCIGVKIKARGDWPSPRYAMPSGDTTVV
jgi:hypothetical protein